MSLDLFSNLTHESTYEQECTRVIPSVATFPCLPSLSLSLPPFFFHSFFFSSSRRRIDCLRHPVPFCSSHYGRAAIEFPRVVFSGTIFNPVPWSEAESRVNRYDAAPPVDGPASISFREIVGRDKGEHWPMKRRRRVVAGARSAILTSLRF